MEAQLPILRTSERTTFLRCGWRWDQIYNEGFQPNRTSKHLTFGDLTHQSLAPFYIPGRRRGPKPSVTFEKIYVATTEPMWDGANEEKVDPFDLGMAMLRGYEDEYGRDEEIEIVAPEMTFRKRLIDVGGEPFYYVGRFDAIGLWLPTGEFFIFEHKTGSDRKKKILQLDEQGGSYWAFGPEWVRHLMKIGAIKKRKLNVDLEMMLYNFLRKAMPDQRPMNEDGLRLNMDGSVSKTQPPPYFERIPVYRDEYDRKQVIKRIRQQHYVMRLSREGKLPVYKNPTDDCSWDCALLDMCELHETGSDWRSFRNQNFHQHDPYADYNEKIEEVG